jgi:hypothetical protein
MNEIEFQNALIDLLENVQYKEESCGDPPEELEVFDDSIKHVASFHDDEIMTNNKGLVVRFYEGSEFQITIVKSR